jgi:hypothetical protein
MRQFGPFLPLILMLALLAGCEKKVTAINYENVAVEEPPKKECKDHDDDDEDAGVPVEVTDDKYRRPRVK